MKILLYVSLIIFGISAGASAVFFYLTYIHKTPAPLPTPAPHQLDAYKIYDLINNYRANKGLNKLLFNPDLCAFAKLRLLQIRSDWSHNGFNEAVKNKAYCASPFEYCGENLGQGYYQENEQVTAWLKSPEHLANIEDAHYNQTCIVTDTSVTEVYAVQEFNSEN